MSATELAPVIEWLTASTAADFSGRDFDSRLRIQKAVYFLKAFKEPVARDYAFGDYFHGPYSPSLARDYYAIRDVTRSVQRHWSPTSREAASFVRESVRRGNDFLEIAATIHAYLARNSRASARELADYVQSVKPNLSSLTREALAFLRSYALIPGAT